MKVKDCEIKIGLKVIDPNTGKIGFYKGDFEGGIFMSMKRTGLGTAYPIFTTKNEFEDWELAPESEKPTINTLRI